jgi:hypothetical protein
MGSRGNDYSTLHSPIHPTLSRQNRAPNDAFSHNRSVCGDTLIGELSELKEQEHILHTWSQLLQGPSQTHHPEQQS